MWFSPCRFFFLALVNWLYLKMWVRRRKDKPESAMGRELVPRIKAYLGQELPLGKIPKFNPEHRLPADNREWPEEIRFGTKCTWKARVKFKAEQKDRK
jgi:hypothetical protein